MLKITVIGGGSVGLAVSASLRRPGLDVTLLARSGVDRGSRRSACDDHRQAGRPQPAARYAVARAVQFARPPPRRDCDVLMVTTKAHDLAAALRPFAQCRHSPGPRAVLLFQNGLGSAEMARDVLGPSVADLLRRHVCRHATPRLHRSGGERRVEPCDGRVLLGDDITASRAGPRSSLRAGSCRSSTRRISGTSSFTKLLFNTCMNPTRAVHREDLRRTPGERPFPRAHRASRARDARNLCRGVRLQAGPRRGELCRTDALSRCLPAVSPSPLLHLQDLEAKRRTEIDVLNGAILRLGMAHGVETPCHATIVDLVRSREPAE